MRQDEVAQRRQRIDSVRQLLLQVVADAKRDHVREDDLSNVGTKLERFDERLDEPLNVWCTVGRRLDHLQVGDACQVSGTRASQIVGAHVVEDADKLAIRPVHAVFVDVSVLQSRQDVRDVPVRLGAGSRALPSFVRIVHARPQLGVESRLSSEEEASADQRQDVQSLVVRAPTRLAKLEDSAQHWLAF